MYRAILNPYPIRTSRVSAPYSRIASPRTVVGDVDVFRLARDISGDTYRPSTLLSNPSQLVDPELRGGDALFPNLRVGRFGNDALYEDNTVLRVAEMIRPDVIDLTSTNPTRRAKALEDIQFNKAGQSPGQAKALAELIRRKPELASSFNIGYGSSLNKEQGLAQKEGRVFEFDPNDEKWKSGFTRKDPNIVQMNDLQGMLLKNAELDTYQGEPLPPYATKLVYNNADRTQDINDPQLFFNPKSRANIDYQGLADAFESIPKDVTSKTGRSLRDRWDRTKDYKAFPPRGQTLVINPDKRTQTIDEIIDDVNQVEGWYSPETADKRAVYSRAEGNNDNRNIPTRADYEEWVRGMGDSINLEPDDYNPSNTIIELFGGIAADRDGNTFPMTRLKRKESSVLGREFDESNAKSAFTFPIETKRAYKLLRDGSPVIEDRTFLLGEPQIQRPATRLGTQYTTPFINPYRQALPQGEIELANGMVVNQYAPVKPPELAREAWAEESALNPNISKRVKGLEPYYRIAGQNYMVGEKEGLAKPFYTPEVILPESLARKTPMYFEGTGGISPNSYRIAGSTSEPGGYNEFNEVMDKGIRISKRLDRLYKENDELADLASLPFFAPQGEAIAYQQSDVLDRIVDAERAAERMGGVQRRLSGKNDQGSFEQERMAYEGRPSAITQYNVDDVLEPSFGSDYSGRTNTGRIRTSVGTEYDAGIPVGAIAKTRLANQAIDPIQLQDDFAEPFSQAQYTRDLIDRGGVLIDTQLGIPILKAPTASFNPATQRNESYLQPVRPSRIANGVANWQAPESLVVGRVGRQIPVENIPDPRNTRIEDDLSSYIKWLSDNQVVKQNPLTINTPNSYTRTAQPSIGQQLGVEPRIAQPFNPQTIYPNAGIGPLNKGSKYPATIGELFGFSALTPEALFKYKDMTLRY